MPCDASWGPAQGYHWVWGYHSPHLWLCFCVSWALPAGGNGSSTRKSDSLVASGSDHSGTCTEPTARIVPLRLPGAGWVPGPSSNTVLLHGVPSSRSQDTASCDGRGDKQPSRAHSPLLFQRLVLSDQGSGPLRVPPQFPSVCILKRRTPSMLSEHQRWKGEEITGCAEGT